MIRRAAIVLASIVVFVVALTGFYVARDPERATLDASARRDAPGKFVRLSDGITQYDLAGPDSGRAVVLLSGFSVPYYLWDPTRDALVAQGYRVLRYNYYGRGFSDRPPLRYDLATYDRQLTELLDTLGIRTPVDVGGVSMGGVIAAEFADQHPDRTRSVILVDAAFGTQARTPFPFGVPGAGEYVMTTVAAPGMAAGQLSDFVHPERHPDWADRYRVQLRYKGFLRSALGTMRGDVFKRPAGTFTRLARARVPILILWGKEDHTVPFTRSDTVRAAFPRAEFQAIDSAGHLPQIEQAAAVDSIVVRFLRAH
jgi:pimeloyl-ACP methyl ester carboxylesterase